MFVKKTLTKLVNGLYLAASEIEEKTIAENG